jgi:hypothetical protein
VELRAREDGSAIVNFVDTIGEVNH